MRIEFNIRGREEMQRAMSMLASNGPKAMGSALWKEAQRVMNDAKAITPVDTAALVNSGHVQAPDFNGDQVAVTMGFGGAASDYAVKVHEDPDMTHKPPTQYKFLEKPLMDASQDMGYRLAQELWAQLK
jgi:hypothetical protein